MLQRIEIENFKAFEQYELTLGHKALLIGPNNAGKSTLVSALRLIAHLVRPVQVRRYVKSRVVEVDLDAMDIPVVNLGHKYHPAPSRISGFFSEDLELRVTLTVQGPSTAIWLSSSGDPIRPEKVQELLNTSIGVVPPVGPFEMEETQLTEKYIRAQLEGRLSPRHFRNQWYYLPEDFELFREAVRGTLPGIDVYEPELDMAPAKPALLMYFREGNYTGELGWAGHGLQVWLQILTHLIRLRGRNCIILDEPDIYLHPDLQRLVVQQVNSLAVEQFVVASHSVDILNEFAPEDVVFIDKARPRGKVLASLQDVQRVVSDLGSTTNSYVARLARSKVCLFLEGGDFEILRRMAEIAGIKEFAARQDFAFPIEGFGNWERLRHLNWVMKNLTGEPVRPHLLLDRDYRCQQEVDSVVEALRKKGVHCHVSRRKELENYLLVPGAIASAINRHETKREITSAQIQALLEQCADIERARVVAQRQAEEVRFVRPDKVRPATVNQRVLEEINASWDQERLSLAGGKELLSTMRRRLEEQGIHPPTNTAILASMTREDVDPEVVRFCEMVASAVQMAQRRGGRRRR